MSLRQATVVLALALLGAAAAVPAADLAAALRQRYAESLPRLQHSPFQRPLSLESSTAAGAFEGTIHALVDRPFAGVQRALGAPARWCELLMLLPNIADCHPATQEGRAQLVIGVVRRVDAGRDAALPLALAFTQQATADALAVELAADRGPLGTRDYRIRLEAVAVDAQHSFVLLRYANSYGVSARLAAQAYLATSGRDKIGFSVVGRQADGTPQYVEGLRGAVERNAMRYYLAVDAYLASAALPAPMRFETALQRWLGAIGQYPQQLAEEDLQAYVDAKRRAYQGLARAS